MDIEREREDFKKFIDVSYNEINKTLKNMNIEDYKEAVELILDAESKGSRVHVTGIGKPGHIAGYVASLLSSTGTPAYMLHGTEAVHGSSGQVAPGDVVIAISNSGETQELKETIKTLKRNGAKIIGVSGNRNSWLAHMSDAFLFAGVDEEGDPLNRAPRASITVEIIVLQGLSILLQSIYGLTPDQYIKWHPGGALGVLRDYEKKL